MLRPRLRQNLRLASSVQPRWEFRLENPAGAAKRIPAWRGLIFCVLNSNQQQRHNHRCRSVELRALCNEVPRTPPGPEGSNGIGIASGAADHPKFLALEEAGGSEATVKSEDRKK
jgi:hypothetical protein